MAMGGALARQIAAFLAVGAFGFVLDAAITISLVQWGGVSPIVARLPAFAIVTLINFALNRAFTFGAGGQSWLSALVRYVLVCLGGVAVNFAVYVALLELAGAGGIAITPPALTLFVACATGAAAFVTFLGFRSFAFRT
jgi:putative flippase GtrA